MAMSAEEAETLVLEIKYADEPSDRLRLARELAGGLLRVGSRVVHTKGKGRVRGRVVRLLAEVRVDGVARLVSYNVDLLEPETS